MTVNMSYYGDESGFFKSKFEVPLEMVGRIIGKHGCVIKSIARNNGTKIYIDQDYYEDGNNMCNVSGFCPDGVYSSVKEIQEIVISSYHRNGIDYTFPEPDILSNSPIAASGGEDGNHDEPQPAPVDSDSEAPTRWDPEWNRGDVRYTYRILRDVFNMTDENTPGLDHVVGNGFFFVRGSCVKKGPDHQTAVRRRNRNTCSGLVYCECTISPGERWLLRAHLDNEVESCAGLGIGVTTCPPSKLPASIPCDSSKLMDRPEYWVIQRGIESPLQDEQYLIVSLGHDGFVRVRTGMAQVETLFFVDVTQELHLVLDLCQCIEQMESIATIIEDSEERNRRLGRTPPQPPALSSVLSRMSLTSSPHSPPSASSNHDPPTRTRPPVSPNQIPKIYTLGTATLTSPRPSASSNHNSPRGDGDPKRKERSECLICFTEGAVMGIYDCGHVCMCEECSVTLRRREQHPNCPICRKPIKDIIKMFF